jgi:hypothetical protein
MNSEHQERSRDLIEVGYFLSRFTEPGKGTQSLPPEELSVCSWEAAYDLFHPTLSAGRQLLQHRNTLKNSRDEFDGYFDNGREGWKESDGTPKKLNQLPHQIYEENYDQNREQIWARISKQLDIQDSEESAFNTDKKENLKDSVEIRIEKVVHNLQAVSEDLLAVFDDIWLSIDHNDSVAISKGARFKLSFNEVSEEYSNISNRICGILDAFKGAECQPGTEAGHSVAHRQKKDRAVKVLDQKVPHSLEEDFSYKRPVGFKVGDLSFPDLNSWALILENLCMHLFSLDPDTYQETPDNDKLLSVRGNKFYSRIPEDLRVPREFCGGVFVETNLSANQIRDNIKKLLQVFGIPGRSFEVFLREDRDAPVI